MPRCLCLLEEPSILILIQITQEFSCTRGMVQDSVLAPGNYARLGRVWGYPSFPVLCSPHVKSREAVKPHLPFSTTAVVELMSFCSPFWHVLLSWLGGMKLPSLRAPMPWWHAGDSGSLSHPQAAASWLCGLL